ncbi:MAG: hypothetical protein H6849_02545 [Alphaproteobacteria bacterium]|nr:MAG: hypothetical protein H6849_02545 [Alphaproteobacteria bacterium]
MRKLNALAADLLSDGKSQPIMVGVDFPADIDLYKMITDTSDTRERLLKRVITTRAAHGVLTEPENHLLRSMVQSLPGNTERYFRLWEEATGDLSATRGAMPAPVNRKDQLPDFIIGSAAIIGGIAYTQSPSFYDPAVWGEGLSFLVIGSVTLVRLTNQVLLSYGVDACACIPCLRPRDFGSWNRGGIVPPTTFVKEARLLSLLWMMKYTDRVQSEGDIPTLVREMGVAVRSALNTHPPVSGSTLSKILVDHL